MTAKEINALRKSGHLKEALENAEIEFDNNANIYTAGALFWCLYDLVKHQSAGNTLAVTERMTSLYSDFCDGDEYMHKALSIISSRTQPLYQKLKKAIENGKKGEDISGEYNDIAAVFKDGILDGSLYSEFGWLIYYALKQTSPEQAFIRKKMLANYLELGLSKPSVLHSLILGEAIKLEKNTPLQFRIRDFIRIWGLESLRDEDWMQYQTENGHTLPSAVERLIGVYAKELKTDGVEAPDEFAELVDKALARYSNNQNMPYFKAIVLISQGKIEEATAYYKDMILRFPSKFYLWDQASDLVEDIDTKVGLLCKALNCGAEDEYIGSVRLKLALLLIQKNLKSNAKYELEKYRQTYQNNNWNLKYEFWNLYNQVISEESIDSNKSLYNIYANKADAFAYSGLPLVLAVKVAEAQNEDRNNPGRKITTWFLRTSDTTIRLRKPTKFGLKKRTVNGSVFDVRVHDNKIVWIREHVDKVSVSWLKEISGEVHLRTDRNGKKYAIIGGAYVSESLLMGIEDGREIKILSIQQKDGRWSAISLLKS